MSINILIATGNKHKFQEISSIMKDFNGLSLVFPDDIFGPIDIEENGGTYSENALIKAKYYFKLVSENPDSKDSKNRLKIDYIVSEDSGLEVACLNNEPGLYTARYAGENAANSENINKLLGSMKAKDGCKNNRNAKFICCACLYDVKHNKSQFFEGKLHGLISESLSGNAGFGYDPVFFVPALNKTLAEISETEKNKISHRVLAFKQILEAINTYQN
jgi:XTP/dITP diphosphohydrolase